MGGAGGAQGAYQYSRTADLTVFLFRMAADIGEGMWVEKGVPKGRVSTAEQLAACRNILTTTYFPKGLAISFGSFLIS